MGVVFEAHDRERDVSVALKTLLHLSPQALLLFKQEFRSVSSIVHPNLIALYELFAEQDIWFFTMELLSGSNFVRCIRQGCADCEFERSTGAPQRVGGEMLEATSSSVDVTAVAGEAPYMSLGLRRPRSRGTAPAPDIVRELLRQVVAGLNVVHRAGKVHRDIKPSNVFVTPQRRAVILDFGLAVEQSSLAHRRDLSGTFAYMPPEQLLGQELSPAMDWYSAGVMLYEALTGVQPFAGGRLEMVAAKRERRLLTPGELVTGVDEPLERLALDLLDPDPSRRPTGSEIAERLAEVRRSAFAVSRPTQFPRPFIGRARQMDALGEAWAAMTAGSTAVATVHGSSGIGKSTLIENFLEQATRDATIIWGRCFEQELVPYKAIDSAIDRLCEVLLRVAGEDDEELRPVNLHALAQLFPVLKRIERWLPTDETPTFELDPRVQRRLAVGALRELLVRLRRRGPLVLVLDDLQWGDVDSAMLLGEVLGGADPPAVLLVLAYRREYVDRSACLETLFASMRASAALRWFDVPVDPLTADDVHEIVKHVMGSAEGLGELVARITRESGGNAYLALELTSLAAYDPGSVTEGGLDAMLARRLAGLKPDARQLLEVVAVHAQPLMQIDAYRAAGLGSRSPAPLAALRFENLLRSAGPNETDELETYHDRVRETVVGLLSAETRLERHRGLATTLEETGRAAAETLAYHFENAGQPFKAGTYYEAAGQRAAEALAFDRAATHYRRSIVLLQPEAERSVQLNSRLAEALANCGRGVEAARAYEAAAVSGTRTQRLELDRRAAYHYATSGHIDAGRAIFDRVLGEVGLRLPGSQAATLVQLVARNAFVRAHGTRFRKRDARRVSPMLLQRFDAAWAVAAPMAMIDNVQSMNMGLLALRLAMKAGDPERFIQALQVAAYAISMQGDGGRQRAEALVASGAALAGQNDDPRLQAALCMVRAAIHYVHGEWRPTCKWLDRAEEFYLRCRGVRWELASVRTLRLYSLVTLGGYAELTRRSRDFKQEAEELGDLYSLANVETFIAPVVHLVADRPDLARQSVRSGVVRWSVQGYHLQHAMAAQALAWTASYEGRDAEYFDDSEQQWRRFRNAHLDKFQNMHVAWLEFRLKTALAASHDTGRTTAQRKEALDIAHWAERRLKRVAGPWASASVEVGLAMFAVQDGDRTGAAQHLLRAADKFGQIDMAGYEWSARGRAGVLIGSARGADLIAAADRWFQSQGVLKPECMTATHVGPLLE
jgi:hypothetical protein